MDDNKQWAVDAVMSTTRHLITLATAIVGGIFILSVQKGQGLTLVAHDKHYIEISIACLSVSVISGFLTQLAIVGGMAKNTGFDVYADNIRILSGLQIVTFLAAIFVLGGSVL